MACAGKIEKRLATVFFGVKVGSGFENGLFGKLVGSTKRETDMVSLSVLWALRESLSSHDV